MKVMKERRLDSINRVVDGWLRRSMRFFWMGIGGVLFVFLQSYAQYYFFYIEQNQFFQNSWPYLTEHLFKPGGLAFILSGFCLQFFLMPSAGAAITALLLTGVGWLTSCIIRQISPQSGLLPSCLLPVIALMLIHFNANYLFSGTIAFLLMLTAIHFSLKVRDFNRRLICHFLMTLILFYSAGSIYVLYTLTVAIYELLMGNSFRRYFSLLVIGEAVLIGLAGVYLTVYAQYRFAFLPDSYFHFKWLPGTLLYLSWISLLLLVTVACLTRKSNIRSFMLQVVLITAGCWLGIRTYGLGANVNVMELDYYCRTEQWDKLLERSKQSPDDFLSVCYANIALLQKGELADKAFANHQTGRDGLIIPWDKSVYSSMLLSDIYFALNEPALSQKMAFEVFVISGNPRMVKRLVQTNLIFGAYPVAEKYIRLLENGFGYRGWAQKHRTFLSNDAAIETDEILGKKRRTLPENNDMFK